MKSFSMVIVPFLLIQEGQLSVTGKHVNKYWLTAYRTNLPKKMKNVNRVTDLTVLTWP